MSDYGKFAYIYDTLISADIDYASMADMIELAFEKYGAKPKLVLDLACGTGNLTNILADRGYDMIGVDMSSDMLSVAREKNSSILYLNQDMRDLDLYGTVDAVLCMTDSLNYITCDNDLKNVFSLIKNYLNPGAPFIFDINSHYKLSKIIANNTFTYDDEDILYVWTNEWDKKNCLSNFDLNFFIMQDNGLYLRFDEHHCQKAYKKQYICELLKHTGFSSVEVFDGWSFNAPNRATERYLFMAR